jgi:hypothetical protein
MRDRWNRERGNAEGALEPYREDRNRGRLVGGVVLMVVGAILLLGRLDVLRADGMASYWPMILVAIGVAKLLGAGERRHPGNALWLIFIGVWAQANVLHWFGLTWHNSWPVVLIFLGLRVLVTELLGRGEARDAQ